MAEAGAGEPLYTSVSHFKAASFSLATKVSDVLVGLDVQLFNEFPRLWTTLCLELPKVSLVASWVGGVSIQTIIYTPCCQAALAPQYRTNFHSGVLGWNAP